MQGGVIAIEKAATDLADTLSEKIVANLAAVDHDITAHITGLVSFRHLDFVMRFFEKEVNGVKSVEMKSYSEGVAELILDCEGEIRVLARQIAKKRFTGFRLEPTNVTTNRIDLKAVMKK
ncbi:MAG: hypothetical protein GY774_20350 [Planctomycetes bacterium]|nr:hypothetical protein [Planctomycetota bacterium]